MQRPSLTEGDNDEPSLFCKDAGFDSSYVSLFSKSVLLKKSSLRFGSRRGFCFICLQYVLTYLGIVLK